MAINLLDFSKELIDEVDSFKNENMVSTSEAFKRVFLSYLAENCDTSITDCQIIEYKKSSEKIKLDGYSFDSYFNTLTLLISDFTPTSDLVRLGKVDIEQTFKQPLRFLKNCFTDYFDDVEESSPGFEAYDFINKCKDDIDTVNVVLITNKQAILYTPEDIKFKNFNIKYDIWDIERLHQQIVLKENTEDFQIDLANKYGCTLTLLKDETSNNELYECYTGVITGKLLAEIYRDEGQRLIEKNVRSFLQAKGKVNKGLKSTLKNEAQMFMAYNNGISTVADAIEIDEIQSNSKCIEVKTLKGWQIVNGGQTTASIFNAYKDKIDLSQVSVQIKLTVIKAKEHFNEISANISKYSNSQNPIKMSDFCSNEDYHIQMERLSRMKFIPTEKGKSLDRWFYERARGQYFVELNRQPTAKLKKEFQEHNPKSRVVSKTVAAKCVMSCLGFPHEVSKGLERNFLIFSSLVNKGIVSSPNEESFTKMIAQVIIFNTVNTVAINSKVQGHKSIINSYTTALLCNYYKNKIDYNYIWEHQAVHPEVRLIIEDLVQKVTTHINNPKVKGVNIAEWCKREECWILLQDRFKKDEL